jgi:uncharacterized damage-inducible protein DinB
MTEGGRSRPHATEHLPYYGKYIALVPDGDILTILEEQAGQTLGLLRAAPERELVICHPPYTWTIKQVLGHLIDSERIFAHRAFRFARRDHTPLPGFDEQAYANAVDWTARLTRDLWAEFEAVRRSHLCLFGSFADDAWLTTGTANDNRMSVRALVYVIAGHELHHRAIIAKRLGRA